jgi:hypothetical protein
MFKPTTQRIHVPTTTLAGALGDTLQASKAPSQLLLKMSWYNETPASSDFTFGMEKWRIVLPPSPPFELLE